MTFNQLYPPKVSHYHSNKANGLYGVALSHAVSCSLFLFRL